MKLPQDLAGLGRMPTVRNICSDFEISQKKEKNTTNFVSLRVLRVLPLIVGRKFELRFVLRARWKIVDM